MQKNERFQVQQLLFCWIGCPLIGTVPVDFLAAGWLATLHSSEPV